MSVEAIRIYNTFLSLLSLLALVAVVGLVVLRVGKGAQAPALLGNGALWLA